MYIAFQRGQRGWMFSLQCSTRAEINRVIWTQKSRSAGSFIRLYWFKIVQRMQRPIELLDSGQASTQHGARFPFCSSCWRLRFVAADQKHPGRSRGSSPVQHLRWGEVCLGLPMVGLLFCPLEGQRLQHQCLRLPYACAMGWETSR